MRTLQNIVVYPFVLMLFAVPALAQTTNYGLGGNTCGDWSSAEPMATEYRDWLLGYLSGVAAYKPKDILKQTSPNAAIVWLRNYCKAHAPDGLGVAAMALMNELEAQSAKSN